MQISEFLALLEHHLVTQLSTLDVKSHPSSEGPRRLTCQWTIRFVASEAAKYPEFGNLAVLLRNVSESPPELEP